MTILKQLNNRLLQFQKIVEMLNATLQLKETLGWEKEKSDMVSEMLRQLETREPCKTVHNSGEHAGRWEVTFSPIEITFSPENHHQYPDRLEICPRVGEDGRKHFTDDDKEKLKNYVDSVLSELNALDEIFDVGICFNFLAMEKKQSWSEEYTVYIGWEI